MSEFNKIHLHCFYHFIYLSVQVYSCITREILYSLPKRKVNALEYSPKDTYLLLFEPFTSM